MLPVRVLHMATVTTRVLGKQMNGMQTKQQVLLIFSVVTGQTRGHCLGRERMQLKSFRPMRGHCAGLTERA